MDLHVASRRSEHLPSAQLHALVPGTSRTLCGLDLGQGLVVLPRVTWNAADADQPHCPPCAAGARSLGAGTVY